MDLTIGNWLIILGQKFKPTIAAHSRFLFDGFSAIRTSL